MSMVGASGTPEMDGQKTRRVSERAQVLVDEQRVSRRRRCTSEVNGTEHGFRRDCRKNIERLVERKMLYKGRFVERRLERSPVGMSADLTKLLLDRDLPVEKTSPPVRNLDKARIAAVLEISQNSLLLDGIRDLGQLALVRTATVRGQLVPVLTGWDEDQHRK